MSTIEELRAEIDAHPLFVQMQLDGYAKWEVCTGCGDLYAYKLNDSRNPIFMEHPENEFGRCKASREENKRLDCVENKPLLKMVLETFAYAAQKRDAWLAEKEKQQTEGSGTSNTP